MSCCGRSGSWIKECGGARHTRLQHTWYEGIQACRAQSQSRIVITQWENAAQPKGLDSFHGIGKADFREGIMPIEPVIISLSNMSASMASTKTVFTTAVTSDTQTAHFKVIAGIPIKAMPMSGNISTPMPDIISVRESVTSQRFENLMSIAIRIILVVTCVLQCGFR